MSLNKRNKVYQIVTDRIIEQLERVDPSDLKKAWFCVGHSPINLSGRAYRGINHVLLGNSGFESNIWATFNQWSELDCAIKKGEKSEIVVLWKFFKESDEDGNATEKTSAVLTRYFRVFNSEQVEGDKARAAEVKFKNKLLQHNHIESADNFVSNYTINERIPVRLSDRAYYRGGVDEYIAMPEIGQFRSPEQYYSVFAHEITHSTGNASRLNRGRGARFGSQDYAYEELIAELGSAMICGSLGLEQTPRIDHAQYIKGWLSALRNDEDFIISAASQAQKAADYALEAAEQLSPAAANA